MEIKDYDYISYDDQLFRLRFETSLKEIDQEQQFERGVRTVTNIIDAFSHLIRLTDVEYVVSDREVDETYKEVMSADNGLSPTAVENSIRGTAINVNSPKLSSFKTEGSIQITLSDGIYHLGGSERLPDVAKQVKPSDEITTPLEISMRQRDFYMPCLTEITTIRGHSDHWLDGDIEKFYLPEATPLAKIDQSRLAASLSNLYDALEPTELVFDTFENTEGWHTPKQTVPGYESLLARHAIEWVLENFEQRQPDEQVFELKYLGDEVNPLITHTQGRSPDEKVQQYLWKAIPEERFEKGATATVYYPDDEAVFVRESRNWWSLDVPSDL